jgi:autotransporter translocation and assembly factor TamB
MQRVKRVKWPVRLFFVLIALALLFGGAVAYLYRFRNDEALARFVMDTVNPGIKGTIRFGKLHWSPRALIDLAVGARSPVKAEAVEILDPEGTRIIYAPRAEGKLDLYALLFGGGHLLIKDLKAENVRCLVAPLRRVPPEQFKVGLLHTFASSGEPDGTRMRVEFAKFEVKKSLVRFRFGDWSLDLDDLETRGTLRHDGGDPGKEGIQLTHLTTVRSGKLVLGDVPLPLKKLRVRNPSAKDGVLNTDIGVDLQAQIAGTELNAAGKLPRLFSGDPQADLIIGARRVNKLVTLLLGTSVGDTAKVSASLTQSLRRPLIKARVTGVELGEEPLRLNKVKGLLAIDLARNTLAASKISGELMRGGFAGGGKLNLASGEWDGELTLKGMDPGRIHPLLGGALGGTLNLKGGLESMKKGLAVLRLELKRSRKDFLPRTIKVGGSVHLGSRILDLAGVTFDGDGNRLKARGSVNLRSKRMDLFLRLGLPRLETWLARLRLPRAVRSVGSVGEIHLRGRFPNLSASGRLEGRGVGYGPLRLAKVHADMEFVGGTLSLKKIRAQGYGGRLDGQASLDIFAGNLLRQRKVPILHSSIKAKGLDLTALGAGPYAIGRLFADVQIGGPLGDLKGSANVRIPRATIQGERYDDTSLRLGLLKDRLSVYHMRLNRAGGGKLALWGDLYFDKRMDLRLKVHRFPVVGIPNLSHTGLGLGGIIDGQVNVTGSLDDPRLGGEVRLARARVRGVQLGSGKLTLTPGSDAVNLAGRFFSRRVGLSGYILTQPRPRLHLTLDVAGLPLEKLFPEVRAIGDVRGTADGRIRVTVDARDGLTWADARFPKVRVTLRHRPPGQRRVREVRLRNKQDLLARYDGKLLHLVKTELVTTVSGNDKQRAEFTLGGFYGPKGTDVRLQGRVAVQILEFLVYKHVRKLTGEAIADVRLTGTAAKPRLTGNLQLKGISLRIPKFDQPILIPHGRVRLVPGFLQLAGLRAQVGKRAMVASGSLKLDRFRPTIADLKIKGDFNFKLLELLLRKQISNATGAAAVQVHLTGPIWSPHVAGTLKVRRIELSPRGWGRTITLNKGTIAFKNSEVKILKPLEGTYDEGTIGIRGSVLLDRFDIVDLYLKINGTGIPQRQPKVYSADLNLDLLLRGHSQFLELLGSIELVDVRYVRKFDIIKQAFIKPRVHEEERPFWKGSQLLENLKLAINVRSTGQMAVKNNFANLFLSGAFSVGGTLSAPRLGGQIRVEEGTFRIPFLRGDYTIRRGGIVFNKRKTIDAAELSITGETLFLDRSGVDYQINLLLEGPLDRIGIKLSSTPSLEQGQIWSLLAFGRTTQQLRAQLKGAQDSSSAEGTGVGGAADAQVKQLTGEILNNIVVDKLSRVTKLDLLRFEMGTETAQLTAKKKLGRYISLAGEYQLGLLGDSKAEGRLELKMHDLLKLVGKLERLDTRLETEDLDPTRARLELKVRLPLR